MSLEDTDGFIDLEQLVAATRRQIRAMALCAAIVGAVEQKGDAAEDSRIKPAITLLQSGMTAERTGRSFVIEVSLSADDPSLPA